MSRRAREAGIGFTLALVIRSVTPDKEKTMKSRGHAATYCALCNPAPFELDDKAIGQHYAARPFKDGPQFMCFGER